MRSTRLTPKHPYAQAPDIVSQERQVLPGESADDATIEPRSRGSRRRSQATFQLLKPELVARTLGVSNRTVRTLVARGQLVAHHVGRSVRIDRESVIEFVAASRITPAKRKSGAHEPKRTSWMSCSPGPTPIPCTKPAIDTSAPPSRCDQAFDGVT
jgi:excisionase family DNA binding protein